MAVPEARITHLAQYHLPKTKRDLKSFLELVSYYRRFIPNLADSTAALTSATVTRSPDAVEWTSARLEALHLIRKSLCCHTTLTIPVSSDSFVLHADASGIGVGAILNVIRNDSVLFTADNSARWNTTTAPQKKKHWLYVVQCKISSISCMAVISKSSRIINLWSIFFLLNV